ncbi:uncharacterized protein LOC62_02G003128 [Vanrija pseudolonga]|uniref:Uncharacterized protein n=1 Tax=Vanrija pseudolonga TaxID=143232 RepID=A0AAF1BGD8_9TREE|nr:hypothetical protein LOC62_02G003128 [Vanrija pseudolonga]
MLPVLLLLAGVATATPLNPFHNLFARQAVPSATPSDLGIPPACTASCAPFLTIYNACQTGAISECLQVCQPNNFSGFQACATCVLTSQGATTADVQNALIPVEQACAAAGAPIGTVGAAPTGAATATAAGAAGSAAATGAASPGVGTVAGAGASGTSVGVVNPSAGVGAVSTPVAGAVGSASAHPSAPVSASASASAGASAAAAKSSANKLAPSAALVAVGIVAMLLQ